MNSELEKEQLDRKTEASKSVKNSVSSLHNEGDQKDWAQTANRQMMQKLRENCENKSSEFKFSNLTLTSELLSMIVSNCPTGVHLILEGCTIFTYNPLELDSVHLDSITFEGCKGEGEHFAQALNALKSKELKLKVQP